MKLELSVITEEKAWKSVPSINKQSISKIIKEVLSYFPAFENSIIEVAVLLTNDAKMQKLNLEFLQKDKPTNVLSFPDHDIDKKDLLEFSPNNEYICIGDVALGYETIRLESIDRSLDIYAHVAHMLIHSVLHLLGYDHKIEEDEKEMMALEVLFLQAFDIRSPY